MSFSCENAFTYLHSDKVRKIADDLVRTAPSVDGDDAIQETLANLWDYTLNSRHNSERRCPAPENCPLYRGRGTQLCQVGQPGKGRALVLKMLRNAAAKLRKAGTRSTGEDSESSRERVEHLPGDDRILENAAAAQSSRAGSPLGGIDEAEFRQWAPKLLERFLGMRARVEDEEPPKKVFPGIGNKGTNYQEKLAAVDIVLGLKAGSAVEALRMKDPDYYGTPAHGTGKDNNQSKRTERHGKCVEAILWQVWEAEMGPES